MQKNSAEIQALRKYYQDKGLTIIGMNDSQGVNLLSSPFSKGFLEQIQDALETATFKPTMINGFSLIINKAEHVDYTLSSNLSLKEIKLAQAYGTQVALEHAIYNQFPRLRKPIEGIAKRPIKLFDTHPSLGIIGAAAKNIYRVNPGDEQIKVASTLAEAEEPSFIYSSGINNLMREVANNPYSLPYDYKNRDLTEAYNYSLSRVRNPESIIKPIESIRHSFEHILSINPNTDIYVVGAYCPKRLYRTGLESFQEAIFEYNETLKALSQIYGQTFIDIEPIAQASMDNRRVHLSEKGAHSVANLILMKMFERKIKGDQVQPSVLSFHKQDFESEKSGAEQMIEFIQDDIDEDQEEKLVLDEQFETIKSNIEEFNFPYKEKLLAEKEMPSRIKEREIEEHQREQKVFIKVLSQRAGKKV